MLGSWPEVDRASRQRGRPLRSRVCPVYEPIYQPNLRRGCVRARLGSSREPKNRADSCKRRKARRASSCQPSSGLDGGGWNANEMFGSGRKVISRVGRKSGRVYPSGWFQDRRPATRGPYSFFRIRVSSADKPARPSTSVGILQDGENALSDDSYRRNRGELEVSRERFSDRGINERFEATRVRELREFRDTGSTRVDVSIYRTRDETDANKFR